MLLASIIVRRFGSTGAHGKAYLAFTGFAAFWFAAETIWMFTELVGQTQFPESEWFYLAGYPFLFASSIFYLYPMRKAISSKMLACAAAATASFLIITLYKMHSYNQDAGMLQIVWAGIYPTADAVVLYPAVLVMILFLKGRVSFFWSLACIAIILNVIADSGFLFLYVDESYFSGHPLDILYLWSYVLFSFGIYSHIRYFKKPEIRTR
ncbi:hypothetical protein [Candidatus Nitrosotenuis cloacae]|uniref:hypothetical protein n=1 Tax=Candidatus Nitrosotenuis cloacae TaxID=1603555 RepID=UPI00228171EE|nr:hypothetical protein [Candidatus Nitrosotenuis cloacae]